MKVAIVTLFGNFNYGNRLQNYAIQTMISGFGHQVITINSDQDTSVLKRFLKKYVERVKGGRRIKSVKELKRDNSFNNFTNKYIPTHIYHTVDGQIPYSVNDEFDMFVVGSDQVWNPLFWNDSDCSVELKNYFLEFSNKPKLSYAASFGVEKLPTQWISRIKPLLLKLDYISVREHSGRKITRDMGIDSQVVLDPTLLLSANEWRMIESTKINNKKYILVYFLGQQPTGIYNQIKNKSNELQAEIINLYDVRNKYYTYGPDTFLELIDKAEIVYTDSFHAIVFSILFHTKFVVYNRKHASVSDMSSRITTLLNIIGINEGISNENNVYYNDEFFKYDELIAVEREKSVCFLQRALGGKRD